MFQINSWLILFLSFWYYYSELMHFWIRFIVDLNDAFVILAFSLIIYDYLKIFADYRLPLIFWKDVGWNSEDCCFPSRRLKDGLSLGSDDLIIFKCFSVIFSLKKKTIQFPLSINLYFQQKRAPKLSICHLPTKRCLSFWRHKQDKWLFQFSKLLWGSYVSL